MGLTENKIYSFAIIAILIVIGSFIFIFDVEKADAAVPRIIFYQGRLYDNNNNLLGGSGMSYYFRFSIWDNETIGLGDRLWPADNPSVTSSTVEYGVFNILIGDTANGGDLLTLDFNESEYYLQIEVASQEDFSDGETLSPRQRIAASGYSINAETLNSYFANESATGTSIPVLSDGDLILGDINPQINAMGANNLFLQGQNDSGDIILNAFSGFVGIGTETPSGKLEIAGGYATSSLNAGGFGLHFGSGGASPDHSQIWWGDNTGWKLNFGTKDANDDFLPRVTFTDTGFVGIGTNSPTASLHIFGNEGAVNLEGKDHVYIQFYPDGIGAGRKAYLGYPSASDDNFAVVNEIFGANIALMPSGNGAIGIGTETPSGKLEIAGGYATSSLNAGGFGLHFGSGGASPDHSQIWWGDNTGWKLNFGTKDADDNFVPRVTFTDTGFVGIGTNSPAHSLDVNGNSEFIGDVKISPVYNSTSAIKISDALEGETIFSADTYNNRIKIGDNDPAGGQTTLMVLDSKADAGNPIGTNGAMYYNANLNKFRCFVNNVWENCQTSRYKSYPLLRDAAGITMTNAPAGGTEITNLISRLRIDLSDHLNARAQFAHSLNNQATVKLRIDFSTDDCVTWNATPLVAAFGSSVGANNNQTSNFSAIPSVALGNICARAVIIGDGVLDPIIRYVSIDIN